MVAAFAATDSSYEGGEGDAELWLLTLSTTEASEMQIGVIQSIISFS